MNSSSPLPRNLALIFALIGIGFSLNYLIHAEVPVGEISGKVYLTDSLQPYRGAEIYLMQEVQNEPGNTVRIAISNSKGHFIIPNVPAGDYEISASAEEHDVQSSKITVLEGADTPIALGLKRNMPVFSVVVHQRMVGTNKRALIAVRGYTDSHRPPKTDRFHIDVYRTTFANILSNSRSATDFQTVGRDSDPAPTLPETLLNPVSGSKPVLIIHKTVLIKTANREGFYYQRNYLPLLKPGIYLINLRHETNHCCTWLDITDTAIVTKAVRTQLLAYVVNIHTGEPISGSRVAFYIKNSKIATGITDKSGLCQLHIPLNIGNNNNPNTAYLLADNGDDEAEWQANLSDFTNSSQQYAVFDYTDRTLYRPGQTIRFKGVVRENTFPEYHAISPGVNSLPARYTIPVGKRVFVELLDPNGVEVFGKSFVLSQWGTYFGTITLLKQYSTGVYTLNTVTAGGGSSYSHNVIVNAYHKPQFSVTATPLKPRYFRGQTVTIKVKASWYSGAPLGSAPVSYDVYSSPNYAMDYPDDFGYSQNGSSDFLSNLYGSQYYGNQIASGTATLDANGEATIKFKAADSSEPISDLPQEVDYTCSIDVTGAQQRDVEQDVTVPVVAGLFRLTVEPTGYLATPGEVDETVISTQNYDGTPGMNVPVTLKLYRNHWDADGNLHQSKRAAQTLHGTTNASGQVVFPVTPPKPGDYDLSVTATDSTGKIVHASSDIWAATDNGDGGDTSLNSLSLLTDKRQYNPGDIAKALIISPTVGVTALVTVEGNSIYSAQTVVLSQHSTIVHIPILKRYGPNVYLDVCYVHHSHFATSEAPLRVLLTMKQLKVWVTPNHAAASSSGMANYLPGHSAEFTVHVTDMQGHPVSTDLAFGVSDEAIYAMRDWDPTSLARNFYPSRSNNVNTDTSFDSVYLGDADKAEPKIVARSKFKNTAYWNPEIHTNSQGVANVSFTLPDNLTVWRATAVAISSETAIGSGMCKIQVTKPFMVQLELPATLTQNDKSEFSAFVHNQTGSPQTAFVRLNCNGITLDTPSTQSIQIASGATGSVTWQVECPTAGTVSMTAAAWTIKGSNGVQYSDGLTKSLKIVPYGRRISTSVSGVVDASESQTETFRIDSRSTLGSSTMLVRLNPSPGSILNGGLQNLIDYPYSFVDETADTVIASLTVRHTLSKYGLQTTSSADVRHAVTEALARLYRLQHQDGGWGWCHFDASTPDMTSDALIALATARAYGVPVDAGALSRAQHAAVLMLKTCVPSTKPLLIYAIALSGRHKQALDAERKMLVSAYTTSGLAYRTLTQQVLNLPDEDTLSLLRKRAVHEGQLVHWRTVNNGLTDDSDVTTALVLRAIANSDPHSTLLQPGIRWLMLQRIDNGWMDDRATVESLLALCATIDSSQTQTSTGNVMIALNGQAAGSCALNSNTLQQQEIDVWIPSRLLKGGKNQLTLTRTGGNSPVFYTITLQQINPDMSASQSDVPGLTVTRSYLKIVGGTVTGVKTQPAGDVLTPGELIRVHIKIHSPSNMTHVMLVDPFPAGCTPDVQDYSDDTLDDEDWNYWWSGEDVRDDRIAFFTTSLPKGDSVIEYNLRVQTPGLYSALPTELQGVYAPGEHAETPVNLLTVRAGQ